ncbi:MAG: UPF0182 family protein [Candidatus Thorarchaeota archaeon]|nr:UPF0182 family protein [Candidatus Thorarchaeota archaeon]
MKYFRSLMVLLISIAIAAITATIMYGWFLGQSIFQTAYSTKAGVDFWGTWTLDNRIFLASFLLAFLSSMITLPQRSTFITFISEISQTGPAVKRLELRTAIPWRLFVFGAFFIFYISIGGQSLTGQNVTFLMLLVDNGAISVSSQELSRLFALPFSPGTSASSIIALAPALEAYQLGLGFISTFLVVSAGRITLSAFSDMLSKKRDIYVVISKILFAASFIIVLELLSIPMWTVNAGTWLSYMALIVGLAAAIIAGLAFVAMRLNLGDAQQRLRSKIAQLEGDLSRLQGELQSVRQEYETGTMNLDDYRRRVSLLMEDQTHISSELRRLKLQRMIPLSGQSGRFSILAVVLIVMVIVLPVAQVFLYGIPMDGDKYIDWKFDYETSKEITITKWASGIGDMEIQPIEDLTSNATPASEAEFLTTVRQWDQQASYLRMKNQIGTNWMQLADSDIVYLRGHEYWIAPLSLDLATTGTSFISQHLFYTHTEGIVVQDAYSGDIVDGDNLVALFNRSEPINTYYGEGIGYSDVVFVDLPSYNEVGEGVYSGTPDYTLTGFESAFYMTAMGPEAWSFIGQDMDMLLQRDVLSRVQSIMLQGLNVDSDPYIVINPQGDLYYAVSVYIDYRLATGYAHENYMRFLGLVLVDIENGEMQFYNPPTTNASFFIDSTYMSYYDWQNAPDWLQSQMKWPEDLYERQLEVAYIYHVEDGLSWKGGNDFHQAPDDSDTRYIISRIGGEERFVAMHNSEFYDSQGRNLAGLYVMGCGDKNFGELVFYQAGEGGFSTLLGPNAAVQAFETDDTVRTQLQLWGEHRYGNRLMYHLGGMLLFVIPVFLVVETSTVGVIQKLGGVGLVDAHSGERVTLGANVVEAYYKMFGLLNQSTIEEGEVGIETASFNPVAIESGELSDLLLLLRNNDVASHNLTIDITVAAGNFSVFWHGSEVAPTLNPTNTTYRLNIGTLGEGDLCGTTPQMTVYLPTGIVSAQYLVVVTLRTEEGIVDTVTLILTVT